MLAAERFLNQPLTRLARGLAADMPWFVAAFVATGLCVSLLIATSSNDDDQTLWLRKESGPYNVAASATGATSANFSMTNTVGPPANV